jgi:hypothetical protein
LFLRLCREGYASSMREAKEMKAREVIQALSYEAFCADYERAYIEVNRS